MAQNPRHVFQSTPIHPVAERKSYLRIMTAVYWSHGLTDQGRRTPHTTQSHMDVACGDSEQAVLVGGRLCSMTMVRCPLVVWENLFSLFE